MSTTPEDLAAFPNRYAVEREIEAAENPAPGTMHLNDGHERVRLPGGTLRRMLAVIDQLAAMASSAQDVPSAGLLKLVCDIRFAVGDNGKRMQPELVEYLKQMRADADAFRASAQQGEPVAWCALTPSGQIAYFDGKPMVMPGPVGNECHPVPMFTRPTAPADLHAFLDAAAGEGLVLAGIDAADLCVSLFPEHYAALQANDATKGAK